MRTNWEPSRGAAGIFPHPCAPDPDLCENINPYTGTSHWFAANGDELSGTFEGFSPGRNAWSLQDNHETADVTGGTGRFASATGHWSRAGKSTSPRSRCVLFSPGKGGSQVSARQRH